MKIEVLTIFPKIFESFLDCSLIKKAIDNNLIQIKITNIREFANPPHFKTDDTPYGGGAGMVMTAPPLIAAIRAAKTRLKNSKTILLSASGKVFNQKTAINLSNEKEIILVCGRYEGIDQRVIDLEIDQEISIGEFITMGGEIPAMVLIESITRLVPDVLHNSESITEESYNNELLEYPQYSRPEEFEGLKVPEVLLSGNHKAIKSWRTEQQILKTKKIRES